MQGYILQKIIKMLYLGWIIGFPARSRENVLVSLVPSSQNNLLCKVLKISR